MAIKKIYGIETEWSIIFPDRPKQKMVADVKEFNVLLRVIREFFNLSYIEEKVIWEFCDSKAEKRLLELIKEQKETIENGGFLPNGARIYVDYPHLEYSTPECLTVKDLIAADKAGNLILQMAAQKASEILGERVIVLKDNSDRKGHSFASHENYLMDRRTFIKLMASSESQNKIIPFLISRQILAGAGKIGIEKERRRVNYQISQRADFISQVSGLSTTPERNIINTRDEPHADKKRFARLHLILGDANFCEWSLYLKIGTTAIVLKMLEDNFIQNSPIVADPVRTVKIISRDPTCKKLIKLIDGRRMSAIDIQFWYLDLAHQYFNRIEPTEEERDILKKWVFVLDKLRCDPKLLIGWLDWLTKKYIIDKTQQRLNLTCQDSKLRIIDVMYHDINPVQGLYYKLLDIGKIQKIITDEQIERFIQNPPQNTRAYLRGIIAKHWPQMIIDWEEICCQNVKEIITKDDVILKKLHTIILENPIIGKEQTSILFKKIQNLIS